MRENELIKPIDSVEKINRNKNGKVEYYKEIKEKNNTGFDDLLKAEQLRLKELDRILKERKTYIATLKEIYEKEANNSEEKLSSRLNGK